MIKIIKLLDLLVLNQLNSFEFGAITRDEEILEITLCGTINHLLLNIPFAY